MNSADFLAKSHEYLTGQKPFVIYRKPTATSDKVFEIFGYFQKDTALYTASDYTESGFVMAPFDIDNQASILIPADKSDYHSATIDLTTFISSPSPKKFRDQNKAREKHIQLVSDGINALHQADLLKVVLSRKISTETQHPPLDIFKRLLKFYPDAFVYCWHHPQKGLWMGATPESLLTVNAEELKTVGLAGTKAIENDKNPQWTIKEYEEQRYVTDFLKHNLEGKVNDLSVSEVQNVRAGNLWHLKTNISARLTNKENLQPILLAIHPTPAVCGEPKQHSKAYILKHEKYDREFYAGFLGELNEKRSDSADSQQDMVSPKTDLYVNLRCMKMKRKNCFLYVGGGITKDSNPESEWEETVSKSHTLLAIL